MCGSNPFPEPDDVQTLLVAPRPAAGSMAGLYGGLVAGIMASTAVQEDSCDWGCPVLLLTLPLGSALGAWLGASVTGERPSFGAALAGIAVGSTLAYGVAPLGADGRPALLSYALGQGLVTALSTLRD